MKDEIYFYLRRKEDFRDAFQTRLGRMVASCKQASFSWGATSVI